MPSYRAMCFSNFASALESHTSSTLRVCNRLWPLRVPSLTFLIASASTLDAHADSSTPRNFESCFHVPFAVCRFCAHVIKCSHLLNIQLISFELRLVSLASNMRLSNGFTTFITLMLITYWHLICLHRHGALAYISYRGNIRFKALFLTIADKFSLATFEQLPLIITFCTSARYRFN